MCWAIAKCSSKNIFAHSNKPSVIAKIISKQGLFFVHKILKFNQHVLTNKIGINQGIL